MKAIDLDVIKCCGCDCTEAARPSSILFMKRTSAHDSRVLCQLSLELIGIRVLLMLLEEVSKWLNCLENSIDPFCCSEEMSRHAPYKTIRHCLPLKKLSKTQLYHHCCDRRWSKFSTIQTNWIFFSCQGIVLLGMRIHSRI